MRKPSFRDMVMGQAAVDQARANTRVDLIAHKLARVEFDEGNKHLPRFFVADSVIDNLSSPWKDALVIKILGKNLGYNLMRKKLQTLWKPKGGFEIIDVDHGVYMVKFDLVTDKDTVLKGGPWMIFDRCLAVSLWSPDFVTSQSLVMKTMVWIRFPGLNLAYYDESFLHALASSVGTPIKVDTDTQNMHRGKYARVCVEIDLSQPVSKKIWFRNHWIQVEFEGIHVICEHGVCYGHLSRNCEVSEAKAGPKPSVHQARAATAGNDKWNGKGEANPRVGAQKGTHISGDEGWSQVQNRKSNLNSNLKKTP